MQLAPEHQDQFAQLKQQTAPLLDHLTKRHSVGSAALARYEELVTLFYCLGAPVSQPIHSDLLRALLITFRRTDELPLISLDPVACHVRDLVLWAKAEGLVDLITAGRGFRRSDATNIMDGKYDESEPLSALLEAERDNESARKAFAALKLVLICALASDANNSRDPALSYLAREVRLSLRPRRQPDQAHRFTNDMAATLYDVFASTHSWTAFFTKLADCDPTVQNRYVRYWNSMKKGLLSVEPLLLADGPAWEDVVVSEDHGRIHEDEQLNEEGIHAVLTRHPAKPALAFVDGLLSQNDGTVGDTEPEDVSHVADVSPPDGMLPELWEEYINEKARVSLGKLWRAHTAHDASKYLYNPIERGWIADYFREVVEQEECSTALVLLMLQLCMSKTPEQAAGLHIRRDGEGLSLDGTWTIALRSPKSSATPTPAEEALSRPVADTLSLPLPELARSVILPVAPQLKEGERIAVSLGLTPDEAHNVVKTLVGEMRDRFGSRIRLDRFESQMRYFLQIRTRDIALIDLIFGHGTVGGPVQRYYRHFFPAHALKTYTRFAAEFFGERVPDS